MLKLVPAFFLLFTFQSFAQYGMKESTISRKIDPEVLWFRKDSLQNVDTTKSRIDLAKYYELNYQCDQTLHWFDRKKEHLSDCLNWCKSWSFHDSTAIEPLISGLEMCNKLDNDSIGLHFYNRILQTFNQNDWSESQKRRINVASSMLDLNDAPFEGVWDGDYIVQEVSCIIDTLAIIHPKTEVYVNPERRDDYELIAGENHYLELKISTRDCRCIDCSYTSKVLIKTADENFPVSQHLDSTNCFLSHSNVWVYEPKTIISFGKLFRNKHGLYLIIAYKNNPKDELYMLQTYWIAPGNLQN